IELGLFEAVTPCGHIREQLVGGASLIYAEARSKWRRNIGFWCVDIFYVYAVADCWRFCSLSCLSFCRLIDCLHLSTILLKSAKSFLKILCRVLDLFFFNSAPSWQEA